MSERYHSAAMSCITFCVIIWLQSSKKSHSLSLLQWLQLITNCNCSYLIYYLCLNLYILLYQRLVDVLKCARTNSVEDECWQMVEVTVEEETVSPQDTDSWWGGQWQASRFLFPGERIQQARTEWLHPQWVHRESHYVWICHGTDIYLY